MGINVKEFEEISREIFAPIYPVIAEQIKRKSGITKGSCLDLGTGTGYLGIHLAKITDLQIYLLDQSKEILEVAKENIVKFGVDSKVETVHGDVHQMHFENQSINLIISRGSIFFWEDQIKALREIKRVLAIGGMAYIGGGFGSLTLKNEISKKMLENNKDWNGFMNKNIGKHASQVFSEKLEKADIKNYEIIDDDSGLWLVIRG